MSNCIPCVEGCDLPSAPNDLKVIMCQLKKEVDKLLKTTDARILKLEGDMSELCVYIKNNLCNSLRCLLNDMLESRRIRQNY